VTFEDLLASGAVIAGSPDQVIEQARRNEAAGTDILLWLRNPYALPHDASMESIELIGRHVIPEFG
jgi:alkanesulfonate monooxygenase SsuD/methylene tetrahydromethanopterin reductase-like flavin-dependent oxidoreductase (luciferase family)